MKYLVFIIILITLLYFNFSSKTKEGFQDNEKPADINDYTDLRYRDTIEITWAENFVTNKKIIIKPGMTVTWNPTYKNHTLIWKDDIMEPLLWSTAYNYDPFPKSITFNQDDNNKLFTYSCEKHPGESMEGFIYVEDQSAKTCNGIEDPSDPCEIPAANSLCDTDDGNKVGEKCPVMCGTCVPTTAASTTLATIKTTMPSTTTRPATTRPSTTTMPSTIKTTTSAAAPTITTAARELDNSLVNNSYKGYDYIEITNNNYLIGDKLKIKKQIYTITDIDENYSKYKLYLNPNLQDDLDIKTKIESVIIHETNTLNLNISNQELILHNIVSLDNDALYTNNSNKDNGCLESSVCDGGRCIIGYDNIGKCYNVIKNLYELNGKNSYIELKEIDNLNTHFKFSLLLNNLVDGNEYIIVHSGIGVWSLIIDTHETHNFKLKLNNTTHKKFNLNIKTNTLYNIDIKVNKHNITCSISNDSNDIKVESLDIQNYDCQYDNKYSKCIKPSIVEKGKLEFKPAPIYFGYNYDYDYEYLNGYLGNFEFNLDKEKCIYNPQKESDQHLFIKEQCINKCLEDTQCNKSVCDYKCKDIKECHFNSKINESRHSIDCMQKCIKPVNKCSTQYCNKQCNQCVGNDCYWLNKSSYLNNDEYSKSGRPYPPNIDNPIISYDGRSASFEWTSSESGLGDPTKGYVALFYKTYKKDEGLRIEWIDIIRCSEKCEYIIKNLTPGESYTLGIKAYNSSGIGMISNLITFKTVKSIINTLILNNITLPTNLKIGNFDRCTK